MKKYDSYKDSGIEWIGEIPSHWEIKRFKYYFSLITEKAQENDKLPKIGLENIESKTGRLIDSTTDFAGEGIRFKINDILFGKLRPYLAKVWLSNFKGQAIGDFYIFRSNAEIFPKYSKYKILNPSFINIINSSTYGSKMPRASWNYISNLPVAFPSFQEQQSIANYLDEKTGEIDEIIAGKKRLIELYEEEKTAIINKAVTKGINPDAPKKDSGIEWLGEIPEHWEVKRLRHLTQIFGRIGYRGYTTSDLVSKGEGAITLSPSNMKDYYMDFTNCTYLSWEKYEESPEIKINNGDILFVKTGSTYGKSSLVEKLTEKATINPQIIVFKNIDCNNKLLWYILKSESIMFQIEGSVVGGTIPTISQAKIINYWLPISENTQEQQSIVEYIEAECSRIDFKIERTKELIELLEEYRTALISEVVSGKIKVVED